MWIFSLEWVMFKWPLESLIYFDSSLHKIFGHLLGLGSFDSPNGPLIHKQTSFPISFNGVKLILTSTIALTAYLRN